ncbi:MAG: iron-only hydrogenase system regulator [Eubacteriales bacterium]|nr:iron-only hydrogenase system regulator [Eubacteriales bacterium]
METRIAVIAIIVEDRSRSEELNQILHMYGEYIVGRMGVPYREKGISVISVILDAPQEKISALSGKLGMLKGVSSKTVYSRLPERSRN